LAGRGTCQRYSYCGIEGGKSIGSIFTGGTRNPSGGWGLDIGVTKIPFTERKKASSLQEGGKTPPSTFFWGRVLHLQLKFKKEIARGFAPDPKCLFHAKKERGGHHRLEITRGKALDFPNGDETLEETDRPEGRKIRCPGVVPFLGTKNPPLPRGHV